MLSRVCGTLYFPKGSALISIASHMLFLQCDVYGPPQTCNYFVQQNMLEVMLWDLGGLGHSKQYS